MTGAVSVLPWMAWYGAARPLGAHGFPSFGRICPLRSDPDRKNHAVPGSRIRWYWKAEKLTWRFERGTGSGTARAAEEMLYLLALSGLFFSNVLSQALFSSWFFSLCSLGNGRAVPPQVGNGAAGCKPPQLELEDESCDDA